MDELKEAFDYQADGHIFLGSPQPMLRDMRFDDVSMPPEPDDEPVEKRGDRRQRREDIKVVPPKYNEDQLAVMPEWIGASKKMFSVMNDGKRFIGSDKQAAAYGLDLMSEFNWNMTGPSGIPGESGISVPGFAFQVAALMSDNTGEENAMTFLQMLHTYSDTATNGATIKRAFRGIFADPLTYAGGFGKLFAMGAKSLAGKVSGQVLKDTLMKTAAGTAMPYDLAVKYPGRTGMVAGAGYGAGFEGGTMAVEDAAGLGPTVGEAATRLGTAGTVGAAVGGVGSKVLSGAIPAAGSAVRQGLDTAGQAAEARMAERGPITDRVMSGGDPMDVIDPALAAAGKLVRDAEVGQNSLLSEVGETSMKDAPQSFGAGSFPLTKENLQKADETTKLLVSKILEKNPDAAIGLTRSGSAAGDSNYLIVKTADGKWGQVRVSDHGTGTRRVNDYLDQLPMTPPPEGKQVFGQISRKSFDDRIEKIVNEVAGQKLMGGARPTKENPVTVVAPTETEPGIIAFHGSGADFDQFSLEKIGTGEGAQAYGYGLYFTDSEDIAKFYKDALTDPGGVPLMYKGKRLDTPWTDEIEERFADELAGLSEGERDDFITVLANLSQINLKSDAPSLRESSINRGRQQRIFDKIIDDVEQPDLGEGKMYKVGLAPKKEDMLDWNKFLSEQPKILDKIKNLPEIKTLKERGADLNKYPGFRIYQILQDSKGVPRKDKAASDQLASVGVEGIKYRAAGSRAANLDAADAEMNYVIFDDKAIKILEKYGIVGPVAITALGAAKQEGKNDGDI